MKVMAWLRALYDARYARILATAAKRQARANDIRLEELERETDRLWNRIGSLEKRDRVKSQQMTEMARQLATIKEHQSSSWRVPTASDN